MSFLFLQNHLGMTKGHNLRHNVVKLHIWIYHVKPRSCDKKIKSPRKSDHRATFALWKINHCCKTSLSPTL